MASLMWATIAFSMGFLVYLVVPVAGSALAPATRARLARWYYGMTARAIGKPAIIERSVGGYSLLEWSRDDEKEAGKVVLDDSMLGDEKALFFSDTDNRLKRWHQKPLAVLHEEVPAVLDAELAVLGKRWRQHRRAGEHRDGQAINPYFEVPAVSSVVSLSNAKELILNGSEPSDPATMEDFTRKRFEKYRSMVGAVEVISAALMAGVGFGLVAAGAYVRQNLLHGGGGGPSVDMPLSVAIDTLVLLT